MFNDVIDVFIKLICKDNVWVKTFWLGLQWNVDCVYEFIDGWDQGKTESAVYCTALFILHKTDL